MIHARLHPKQLLNLWCYADLHAEDPQHHLSLLRSLSSLANLAQLWLVICRLL